jgi:probable HAF family extracellular repeat protein
MEDLGTLGGESSLATAVSEKGVVVGAGATAHASSHAFVWTDKAGMVDLGALPGSFSNSYATGVSKNALVIGFSWKTSEDFATHGFAWTRAHGMVDIGTFGGDTYPNAVSSGGLVVGTSYTVGNAASRPFAWTQSGGLVDLGTFGGPFGEAISVSDTGMVVGYSYTAGDVSYPHPFAWTEATGMIDLGTLGSGNGGYAVAVNDNGVVVGYTSTVGNEVLRPFKWTLAEGMIDLGTLSGNDSYATGVSTDGLVVGNSVTADGQGLQGFVWTQADGLVGLSPLGGSTYSQVGTVTGNDSVLGFSYNTDGAGHATVWRAATGPWYTTASARSADARFPFRGRGLDDHAMSAISRRDAISTHVGHPTPDTRHRFGTR